MNELTPDERKELATEVRDKIISQVAASGGHLASNLGVVELTVALHTSYNQPEDIIIWDVGHQCYAHKLLTGRYSNFHTLRQFDGICGFPTRTESFYDCFGTGHASTSISAALGFAKARDLQNKAQHVVAVIGDGALTGGMAWEAMNNVSHLKTNLTVILNDNEMSISRNVGALSTHLSKLRLLPLYRRVESKAKDVISHLPMGGKTISRTAEGILHGVTHLIAAQTGVIFEEMGFTYIGPIDGHDMELLLEVLNSVKQIEGPVLVHVLTTKGKGYQHAEQNSRVFHGVPAFSIADGKLEKSSSSASFTQIFSDALVDLAEKDKRIVAITAAMPDGTGLSKFAQKYPDRFFDVGIAEQHAVTFAAGLAAAGLRPVVAIYSTFLQRSYDQIVHDVCLQKLPVVFALDRAGLVGDDGPTHHGVFDLSYLRHIPSMTVAVPSDEQELRGLLHLGINHNAPYSLRYPRGTAPRYSTGSDDDMTYEVGKGRLISDGDDLCIIAVGTGVLTSRLALDMLRDDGISAALIDARFVKPLDRCLILDAAGRYGKLVLVEENTMLGGFGSAVLELLAEAGLYKVHIKQVGLPDEFICQGDKPQLSKLTKISAESIRQVSKELVSGNVQLSGIKQSRA